MVLVRKTLAEIVASAPSLDRSKIDATTEDDIRRHTIEDGYDPDEELREADIISPWYVRKRLKMTQQQFADVLGIPVKTLQNWEQNRVARDPSTIALMTILAREPEAALRALSNRAAGGRWQHRRLAAGDSR